MDHRVRIFENAATLELAKFRLRASCLKWHGDKQSWIVEFQYNCTTELAKSSARGYLVTLYQATQIEFWVRADKPLHGEFYATFVMEKVDLEGYRID